jgi:hypothetical protein
MMPEQDSTALDKQIWQLQYSIIALQACRGLSPAQREVIDIEIRVQSEMIADLEAQGGHRKEFGVEEHHAHTGGRGAWNGRKM